MLEIFKSFFSIIDYDWDLVVNILSIVASTILSTIAIVISVKTLRQSNDAIIESSRANIMLYFDVSTKANSFIILKNFGNSIGKVIKIDISPKLNYSKSPSLNNRSIPVIEFSNVLLAPNQTIKSWFPFREYPDKLFKIDLYYETLNKKYEEHYSIDTNYVDNVDYLYIKSDDVLDEKNALVNINNTLIRFTEKF